MTEEQQAHVDRIKSDFRGKVQAKYANGVKEHGGNLWERDALYLVEQAMDEAMDQYVYLHTLRERLLKGLS